MRKLIFVLPAIAVYCSTLIALAGCVPTPKSIAPAKSAAVVPAPAAPAPGCPEPGAQDKVPPSTAQAPEIAPAAQPSGAVTPPPQVAAENNGTLISSSWDALPGWGQDSPVAAWDAFLKSCSQLRTQIVWQHVCSLALSLPGNADRSQLLRFFEDNFVPYQVVNSDGSSSGTVTGYYEPLLKGSRKHNQHYRYPLYTQPDDLIVVELSEIYPELKNKRLRGRLEGNKVVPYPSRADIEGADQPHLKGRELVWVDDPVELFFLHIQGSGRVQFENGKSMHVGYAEQNGHPFRSVGRLLIERGEMTLANASMQGIKDWARRHPERTSAFLNTNPSYVFFKELPGDLSGPIGTLGVPLTAERSIAIDPRVVPLGSPVYLATTFPNSRQPLNRLVLAQDTGGAINGAVRADFFWGFGDAAGKLAGGMKQSGQMWVLLPHDYKPAPDQAPGCCSPASK